MHPPPACSAARSAPRRLRLGVLAYTSGPATVQGKGTVTSWDHQLPLGSRGMVTVHVELGADGSEQLVTVFTNAPGRLLLHWGVEGGKGYKGGWRLPGARSRPEGTAEYKQRALQTPFTSVNGNGLQVGGCCAATAGPHQPACCCCSWRMWPLPARTFAASASGATGRRPCSMQQANSTAPPLTLCLRLWSCGWRATRPRTS